MFKKLFGRSARIARRVELRPQGLHIDVHGDDTLLQAVLAHGVRYPHNCTVGTCGSCKTRLCQGRVKALSDFGYALGKAEIEAGFILACQAVPQDELTVIEAADPGAELPAPASFSGRITATEPLTHDIVRMEVALDRPLHFVAGQYASIRLPGMERARHYSFATAPRREGQKVLSFYVRRVPGGRFTQALFDGQAASQALAIEAPHGSFRLRPGEGEIVCVAGGSGLAPLMSLLQDMRQRRAYRPCRLLFGARTQADLYELQALQQIASAWDAPFQLLPVLSHEPAGSGWAGARGWVTDFIADPARETDWAQAQAYLCGPPAMVDAALAALTALGMPIEQVFHDRFVDGAPEPDRHPAPAETTTSTTN